jgi:hypothetical protein
MKFIQYPIIAALCSLLVILPITGCTVSQEKINSVIREIATYAPIITDNATTLATAVQSFDPADAVLIQKSLVILLRDGPLLTTLCNQYLANPSSSVLNQITALVDELATVDSDALLAALQIKNPQSLETAKMILAGIATAVTVLSVYLSSINIQVSSEAAQSIKKLAPYVQTSSLISELNKAKSQGLVPENTTLTSFGF